MAKGLTIMAIVVAILLLIIFSLDLVVQFPFRRAKPLMDIAFILCSAGLAYISWNAWKDLR